MRIFTIGFTQKSAKQFFEAIKQNQIPLLLDIRLNNKSQLAGFSKGSDLEYFLAELCGCEYRHCEEYAPTNEILSGYRKKTISWDEYETLYAKLMEKRGVCRKFFDKFGTFSSVCLLCSEPTPEHCHRRLLAEMLYNYANDGTEIIHL